MAHGHETRRDDVAAYVLGALEPAEAAAFERHLDDCADCRAEVARLSPAVAAVAESVEPADPPPSLKRSLMATVEAESRETPEPASVRRGPLRRRPALAWAAAAVLLALVGVAGFGLGRTSVDETRTLSVQVNRDALPRASGTLTLIDDGRDGAVLSLERLPEPPPGRAYQAWLERDGRLIPQPTFRPGADGSGSVALVGDVEGARRVLLTREPIAGSRTPSEQPVSSVAL
jgi:hypothetical protein